MDEWKAVSANDDADEDAGAWQVYRMYRDSDGKRDEEFFGEFYSRAGAIYVAAQLNLLNAIPLWVAPRAVEMKGRK